MNKKVLGLVVVVVIVLAGGGIALATHKSTDKTSTDSTSTMSASDMAKMDQASDSSSTSSTPSATSSVTIDNFAFSPANITVKVGTKVTWTNKDSATHTVTETDSQTGPDSGNLATGKSYSFTYTTAGTFKYHCAIHPDMLGTVTVTN